jgi:uncharacterized protein (DUF1684 family)
VGLRSLRRCRRPGARALRLLLVALLVQQVASANEHRSEIEAWQKKREASLTAEGGWLTVVGLTWLTPGAHRFGADAANEIILPAQAAPARAGRLVLEGKAVTVEVEPGAKVTLGGKPVTRAVLHSDAAGATPDVLALGSVTLQIIDRGGRLGVRVKDQNSAARRAFKGLRFYPIQADYRVRAHFVAHPSPVSLTVPSALGTSETMTSPGYVSFRLNGKIHRLDPVVEGDGKELFFIFRDRTSGQSTYGAGRFLYAAPPGKDGAVVLDFNKAYSPPCAFTPYATCPLPPPQNRMPISIEAGERFDVGSHR